MTRLIEELDDVTIELYNQFRLEESESIYANNKEMNKEYRKLVGDYNALQTLLLRTEEKHQQHLLELEEQTYLLTEKYMKDDGLKITAAKQKATLETRTERRGLLHEEQQVARLKALIKSKQYQIRYHLNKLRQPTITYQDILEAR